MSRFRYCRSANYYRLEKRVKKFLKIYIYQTDQFLGQISLHPGEGSGVEVVLHRAVRVVELDGGVGVHPLLQTEQSLLHTVHLPQRQINSGQRFALEGLSQILPLRGHLQAVAAPRGVELDKGVALPSVHHHVIPTL